MEVLQGPVGVTGGCMLPLVEDEQEISQTVKKYSMVRDERQHPRRGGPFVGRLGKK